MYKDQLISLLTFGVLIIYTMSLAENREALMRIKILSN